MKRTLLILWLGISSIAAAQMNPRGKAALVESGITIDYGRPSAKGRDVMGMIQPGSSWRMGADAATTLATEKDLQVGTTRVARGSYTLSASFIEKEKWNLVLSKDGAAVAEVPGRFEKDQPLVEQMTIELRGQGNQVSLVLTWGTYRLTADFIVL